MKTTKWILTAVAVVLTSGESMVSKIEAGIR